MKNRFKQTEIGKIPEDWAVKPLIEICTLKSGNSITSKDINDLDKYPCYGGNGLRGYTSQYTHDGTFPIIGRQGALCGNIQLASGKFFASEHAIVVSPKHKTDMEWLSKSIFRIVRTTWFISRKNAYSANTASSARRANRYRHRLIGYGRAPHANPKMPRKKESH
jgi:hypothetical protein